ncbi:Secreted lipase [Paramyrothecium foliicola]|nr:Secreted lipase [Paramyrothecium foliicola]
MGWRGPASRRWPSVLPLSFGYWKAASVADMHLGQALTTLTCVTAYAVGALAAAELPLLKLPYGTWRASKYDEEADVYTFRNVRFAAPPVGALRFAQPAPPEPVNEIQDGSYGNMCLQLDSNGAARAGSAEGKSHSCAPSALREKAKDLSVAIWIYGGSYTGGAKDTLLSEGLYDGTGFAYQSKGKAVVVVPNYRLGVLGGWWGGATPIQANATSLGLADQRAALQWIQDNIHLVGGNPADVTVFGQSAGGGSIMHQITQYGGKRDPLFHRAMIFSPGWADVWDPKRAEGVFQTFATNAGCAGGDFDCLRAAPASQIIGAQARWSGVSLGPTPDGGWIRDHNAFELESGNYWKDLDSVVVTHVINEGGLFVRGGSLTDRDISANLNASYANAEVVAAIEKFYPPVNSTNSPYRTGVERQTAILSDSIFLGNYRRIAEAFAGRTFVSSRTRGNAGHGDDNRPTWYNPTLKNGSTPLPEIIGDGVVSQAWQSYLVSFAVTGNVNPLRNESQTIRWPRFCTASRERLTTLEIADDGFKLIQDPLGTKSVANFWSEQLRKLVQDL